MTNCVHLFTGGAGAKPPIGAAPVPAKKGRQRLRNTCLRNTVAGRQ